MPEKHRRSLFRGKVREISPSLDTMPPGALLINVFFGTHTHTRTHRINGVLPGGPPGGPPSPPKNGPFLGPKKGLFSGAGAEIWEISGGLHGFLEQDISTTATQHSYDLYI